MIDCEYEVYNRISDKLHEAFDGVSTYTEIPSDPKTFPVVSIEMTNAIPTSRTQDSSNYEKYTTVTFNINVFSNKVKAKKSEAKEISDYIDKLMYSMNFNRASLMPVPNEKNASIYRMTGVYNAVTDGKYFYRG